MNCITVKSILHFIKYCIVFSFVWGNLDNCCRVIMLRCPLRLEQGLVDKHLGAFNLVNSFRS